MWFSRPKVVSFYHIYQYYTVGGNRLYNFAHRSSQLLHNGPGSWYIYIYIYIMRGIVREKLLVNRPCRVLCAAHRSLCIIHNNNGASYFCVIPPKKGYIFVIFVFHCYSPVCPRNNYMCIHYTYMRVCVYICTYIQKISQNREGLPSSSRGNGWPNPTPLPPVYIHLNEFRYTRRGDRVYYILLLLCIDFEGEH